MERDSPSASHENHILQTVRTPYGQKIKEEISLEHENTDLLQNELQTHCVACNTATTNAIRELRENMTFLYWYRTCIKPAATNSKNTNDWHSSHTGTLISELFNKTAQQFKTQNH
jgi:glutamate racemase